MRLGIDLGGTIVNMKEPGKLPFPSAFETILDLSHIFDEIHIVSRVNSDQKERSIKWIYEHQFCESTGIPFENIHYCFDRRDKAFWARGLDLTHFIDDRPEVMFYMDRDIDKILFKPVQAEVFQFFNQLFNIRIANDWKEIGMFCQPF